MNELQIMNIQGIECYEKEGTAYLKLEAVARGLGFTTTQTINGTEYTNVRWNRVDEYLNELGFATSGKRPDFIPENIFYRLAMKAKNAAAEAFQAKIADEVVPSIRRHGVYATAETVERLMNDPDFMIRTFTALKEEREQRKMLEAKNSALAAENEAQKQAIADFQPMKQYIDTILSSSGTMATSQIAADYDMSAKRLNRILHEAGIQRRINGQWILYAAHMGKGYTDSKTFSFVHTDGTPDAKPQTVWTQKGRLKIHEILTARGIQAVMDRKVS